MPTFDGDHDSHSQPYRDLHLDPAPTIEGPGRVSLGKTNYCVRALKEKGLVKWGNFTQNPNKFTYLHILTREGLAHKLRLTAHFLACKEAEYDRLRAEIAALRQELHPNDAGLGSRLDIDARSLEKAGA